MKAQFEITVPEESILHDSFLVMWEKMENAVKYLVFLDHKKVAAVTDCDVVLEGLASDTDYHIWIVAEDEDQKEIDRSRDMVVHTRVTPEKLRVTDFGAKGDGKFLNTGAIQSAIDACRENGMVVIPKGVFRSGALFMKSGIGLCLEEGAVLMGSDNLEDYPIYRYRYEGTEQDCYASLLNTREGAQKNIWICGKGVINANGSILRKKTEEEKRYKPGRAICLRNTDRVYLKDITVSGNLPRGAYIQCTVIS